MIASSGYVRQVSRITNFFGMFNLVLESINVSFYLTCRGWQSYKTYKQKYNGIRDACSTADITDCQR